MYLLEDGSSKAYKVTKPVRKDLRLRLLGSGTILREVRKAAEILRKTIQCWWMSGVTSYNELRREALAVSRENMLSPSKGKMPFVTEQLGKQSGPVISTTDYMKLYSDQIREFVRILSGCLVQMGLVGATAVSSCVIISRWMPNLSCWQR